MSLGNTETGLCFLCGQVRDPGHSCSMKRATSWLRAV